MNQRLVLFRRFGFGWHFFFGCDRTEFFFFLLGFSSPGRNEWDPEFTLMIETSLVLYLVLLGFT